MAMGDNNDDDDDDSATTTTTTTMAMARWATGYDDDSDDDGGGRRRLLGRMRIYSMDRRQTDNRGEDIRVEYRILEWRDSDNQRGKSDQQAREE